MECQIIVTAQSGQIIAGLIHLDGSTISTSGTTPGYEPLMAAIVSRAVFVGDKRITVKDDPQAWFEALPQTFNGSYLRALINASENKNYSVTIEKYSPDQPRDEQGRWTDGGGGGYGSSGAGQSGQEPGPTGTDGGRNRDGNQERIPNAYGQHAGGIRTVNVAGHAVTAIPWEPSQDARSQFNTQGITPTNYLELRGDNRADAFISAINASKESNPAGASVYVYPAEEYSQMRLFVTENGKGGVAVKADGDIVSLFNTPGSGNKGVAFSALNLAIQNGGRKLDAFDTVLPKLYAKAGFAEVARLKWDDSQAPADWNKTTFSAFNNGEPDVVFMTYSPHNAGVRAKTVSSYAEAVALQEKALNRTRFVM